MLVVKRLPRGKGKTLSHEVPQEVVILAVTATTLAKHIAHVNRYVIDEGSVQVSKPNFTRSTRTYEIALPQCLAMAAHITTTNDHTRIGHKAK